MKFKLSVLNKALWSVICFISVCYVTSVWVSNGSAFTPALLISALIYSGLSFTLYSLVQDIINKCCK